MGGAVVRAWFRMSSAWRAGALLLASLAWLVAVLVVHAHGWLWSWLLPVAFMPFLAVVGVLGARSRVRRAARRTSPPVEVAPLPAGAPGLALPLVGLLAFVTSRVAARLMTDGDVRVVGLFFAGIVWVVLVQMRHSEGAPRPWNLPPLLFGLAAAVSLGLGGLFALVPDQMSMAMLGALFGPMLTWFAVWLVRWLPRRRSSPRPATTQRSVG